MSLFLSGIIYKRTELKSGKILLSTGTVIPSMLESRHRVQRGFVLPVRRKYSTTHRELQFFLPLTELVKKTLLKIKTKIFEPWMAPVAQPHNALHTRCRDASRCATPLPLLTRCFSSPCGFAQQGRVCALDLWSPQTPRCSLRSYDNLQCY